MTSHLQTSTGPILVLLLASTALAGPTPAQKCESQKNNLAGQYDYCRQKAESKFALSGDGAARTAALQKCGDKFGLKWPGTESKAGGTCPSAGDQTHIQQYIDTATTNVATALAGGTLPDCAAPQGQVLATGQTTCWDSSGNVIPCAGTGQDGELQKGLPRAYADNGDGTITDTKTGLMWEKLSADGSIHDMDNSYAWADAFGKVAALNAGGGFAGHTDWRVPNVSELLSIVNYAALTIPAVTPVFYTGCVGAPPPVCTVLTCSCTAGGWYWSSSSYTIYTPGGSTSAWVVHFAYGWVSLNSKPSIAFVRAVRGGS
jgi:hypothetical protein